MSSFFNIQQEQHPEAGLSGRIGKHKNHLLFRLEVKVYEVQKSTKKATRIQKIQDMNWETQGGYRESKNMLAIHKEL